MKFEDQPTDRFAHGLVFECDKGEVEVIASAYRELVNLKYLEDDIDSVQDHEYKFSMWNNSPDQTLFTNYPLQIAVMLSEYHERTKRELVRIAKENYKPAFDCDALARRRELGEKALLMSMSIKMEFDNSTLLQMLDDQRVKLFETNENAPHNPNE
jgi:hypothetical protein